MAFWIIVLGVPLALATVGTAYALRPAAAWALVGLGLAGLTAWLLTSPWAPSHLERVVAQDKGVTAGQVDCKKTSFHLGRSRMYHCIVHSGGFLDDYLDNDCVALLQDETVQYFPLERCGGNVAPE